MITVALLAFTSGLRADLTVTPITQADIDALDSSDIAWNAQFFPGKGSMPDEQYSVGSGLSGTDFPRGTTTWAQDPAVNPLSVTMTGGGTLQAEANSAGTVSHGVTDPYNEVWVFIRDDTPGFFPGDYVGLSGIVLDTGSSQANIPDMEVFPDSGFAGYKVSGVSGDFDLDAVLSHQHIGSADKEWNVNMIGVWVVPESATTLGTPHAWYTERGITNAFETYDSTDFNDDGFTGHEKYLMGVDDLFDDTDYFRTIGLSMTNGTPSVVIPHSKTDRLYRVEATPILNVPDWTYSTNALGVGGTLLLELPEAVEDAIYYRGTVELP
jgi:hypothetical protein